jgi:hypothetical protein
MSQMLGRRRRRYPSLDAFVASLYQRRPRPRITLEQAEGAGRTRTGAVALRPPRCKTKAPSKSASSTSSLRWEAQVGFSPP